jgi:hypothetical protein
MKTISAPSDDHLESSPDEKDREGSLTTAIHLPRQTWTLLRAVAFQRAQKRGGRASVSGLIVELVEKARPILEKEISGK